MSPAAWARRKVPPMRVAPAVAPLVDEEVAPPAQAARTRHATTGRVSFRKLRIVLSGDWGRRQPALQTGDLTRQNSQSGPQRVNGLDAGPAFATMAGVSANDASATTFGELLRDH